MDCSMTGLPVHHQLPEFTQTHVHWVSDAIQPSHPLSSPSPPAFNLSQQQGLFKWVSSSHQVAKVWSFSFSIYPSNEYSGLISFRMAGWIFLQSKGLSGVFFNTTQSSHDYPYILSHPSLPPLPHPIPPGHHLRLGSLCYTATSHQLSIWLCKYVDSSFPFISLSPTHTVSKSIPYVCVSIPFLQSFISIIFCNCIYMCYLVKNVLQNHETLLSQKFDHWFLIFSTRHRASHLAIIFSFNSFKEQN